MHYIIFFLLSSSLTLFYNKNIYFCLKYKFLEFFSLIFLEFSFIFMSMIFYIKIFKTQNIGLYIFDIFVKIEVSDMSVIIDNYYYLFI